MSKYRIQTVAQITGLSPALIRAWEARYQLVVPQRSPAGYRLYNDEDVAVLQGAQRLVASGMAPMQVATLSRAELLHKPAPEPDPPEPAAPPEGASADPPPPEPLAAQLLAGYNVSDIPDDVVLPRGRRGTPVPAVLPNLDEALFGPRIQQVVDAFAAFDTARVEQLLATPLAVLPPEVACQRLLVPLLREVGERWHNGALSVAGEHFGTNLVRSKILTLIEALRRTPGAHRIVCACPPGELHEIGLMLFALQATLQGWEPIYLGANLPLFDLLEVVTRTRPELVGLSVVQRVEAPVLCRVLGEARALIGSRSRLLIGGCGIDGMHDVVRQMGCLLLPESGRLDDLLTDSKLT